MPIPEDRLNEILEGYEEHILSHINEESARHTKRSDRLADKIAEFGGSWMFIIIFACFLIVWMVWNSLVLTKVVHFDPYPFILLNLLLSFTAAFQAPMILMSQNRQATRDKHETLIDYAINYRSAQEVDDIQGHLHRMEDKQLEMEAQLKNVLEMLRTLKSH